MLLYFGTEVVCNIRNLFHNGTWQLSSQLIAIPCVVVYHNLCVYPLDIRGGAAWRHRTPTDFVKIKGKSLFSTVHKCGGPRRRMHRTRCQKFMVSPLLDIIYTPTTFCIGHKLFVWEFCSDVSFHEVCTNIKAATHLFLFYYLFGALGL